MFRLDTGHELWGRLDYDNRQGLLNQDNGAKHGSVTNFDDCDDSECE